MPVRETVASVAAALFACAFLLEAPAAHARKPGDAVTVSLDSFQSSGRDAGWDIAATWSGRRNGRVWQGGVEVVRLRDAQWQHAGGAVGLGFGERWSTISGARLGGASIPGEEDDYIEISNALTYQAVRKRLWLEASDRYFDVGDTEGHLAQVGVTTAFGSGWTGGLSYSRSPGGDLATRDWLVKVTSTRPRLNWTAGARRGRSAPTSGLGSLVQHATEVYVAVSTPVRGRRIWFALSRLDGELFDRTTLSVAFQTPLATPKGAVPPGDVDDAVAGDVEDGFDDEPAPEPGGGRP